MLDFLFPVTTETLIRASLMYLGFFFGLFVIAWLFPGFRKEGFRQPDGGIKSYKLSGLLSFVLVTAAVVGGVPLGLSLTPVLEHFWSLLIVANVVAALWTAQLFFFGRRHPFYTGENESFLPRWLADIWFGPLRNPTLLGVDIKMFAYQPSLIGLWVVVAAFAFRQWEVHGVITPQMWCFQAFWWTYLFTHYIREDFMLSTWDIIAENFGFMLAWGDLVYVTFFYSIGGWFLIDWLEPLPVWALAAIVALHLLGHWIFRGANWQKDRYKRDPTTAIWGKPAQTLGGKLLVSGWWGVGRKINYTGEIIVYFSFALCTGFQSWIPYILPASLVVLLTHRAWRDDKKCRAKYGELWDTYCRKARFKVFPLIY